MNLSSISPIAQPNQTAPSAQSSLPKKLGKSSVQVSLVLLGAAALAGCDRQQSDRYEYNDRGECVKDWGEEECPAQSSGSGGGGHGGYYYYRSVNAPKNPNALHAKSVVRGGFGSVGRVSS